MNIVNGNGRNISSSHMQQEEDEGEADYYFQHHPCSSLSADERADVQRLRESVVEDVTIPFEYDTPYNIHRWLQNARNFPTKGQSTFKTAEKSLRNHLRLRRAMGLDTEPIPTLEENPIATEALLPVGPVKGVSRSNLLVWTVEYRSLSFEGLMHKLRSSESLIYHFWWYEQMRKEVNRQERLTGKISGIHAIMDLNGYPMNPFAMLFVSSGSMGYYTHLFHYVHYPGILVCSDIINAAKWMSIPYKLVKSIMPSGFADRFRIHDSNYREALGKYIESDQLAEYLGGGCKSVRTAPARLIPKEEYWCHSNNPHNPEPKSLTTLTLAPRRRKMVCVHVQNPNTIMSWYFTSDGEFEFGIFHDHDSSQNETHLVRVDIDEMVMMEPWFRISAKIVPEGGSILCQRPGLYYMVFCNKQSWMTRRTIRYQVTLGPHSDDDGPHSLLKRTLSF